MPINLSHRINRILVSNYDHKGIKDPFYPAEHPSFASITQVIIAVSLLGPNLGSAPSQKPPQRNPRLEEAQQPAAEYSPSLETLNLPIFGSSLDYFRFRQLTPPGPR